LRQTLAGYRLIAVDALAISRANGLGRIVNSALLGALARAIGNPPLAVLEQLLLEQSPKLQQQNVDACHAGYHDVDDALLEA
jgi:Pyruvate/2-oxoacid:ferredoxin oxidoreductase gamma subunit